MLACRFIIIVIHLGKYIAAFILRLIETNVHLPAHHLNLHLLLLLLLLLLIQFDMPRPAAAAYAAAAAAAAGRPSARRLLPQQLLSRLAARSLARSLALSAKPQGCWLGRKMTERDHPVMMMTSRPSSS
jgi:hypothetical protein